MDATFYNIGQKNIMLMREFVGENLINLSLRQKEWRHKIGKLIIFNR
jgi:hypothetical protein